MITMSFGKLNLILFVSSRQEGDKDMVLLPDNNKVKCCLFYMRGHQNYFKYVSFKNRKKIILVLLMPTVTWHV